MSVIPEVYTLLVVDDEPDIHAMTQLALRSMSYKGRDIQIIPASSGEEALDYMRLHPETAVILMDVVMESDIAGLESCRKIREELGNETVRLILRTGQPGQAPEKKVIENYEIDGYLAKAEMTSTRLFTAVRTALKAYTELKILKWLEGILTFLHQSSTTLQSANSLQETFDEALMIAQEIVPTDLAIFHLNLAQTVQEQSQFTLFNGSRLAESTIQAQVNQWVEQIQQTQNIQPFTRAQPFEQGFIIPLGLPEEIGWGWIFMNMPLVDNPTVESAIVKAMELLIDQTNNAIFNAIIQEQAAALESYIR